MNFDKIKEKAEALFDGEGDIAAEIVALISAALELIFGFVKEEEGIA